jgi:hypothetical protein
MIRRSHPLFVFGAALVALGCERVVEVLPPRAVEQGGAAPSGSASTGGAGGTTSSTGTGYGPTSHCTGAHAGKSLGPDEVIATLPGQLSALALTESDVFVTEWTAGAVVRIPKTGGPPVQISAQDQRLSAIVASDAFVIWASYASGYKGGSIRRVSLADGSIDELASDVGQPWGLALDGDAVVYNDGLPPQSASRQVRRLKPGSAAVALVDEPNLAVPLASSPVGLLFGIQGTSTGPYYGAVRRRSPDGSVSDLYSGLGTPHVIVADGQDVYFATDDGKGTVRRGTLGGAPPVVLATNQDMVLGGAVCDGYFYYTSVYLGVVRRIRMPGAVPENLAHQQASPTGIAVDDSGVYWVDQDSGQVHRRAW